MFQKQLQQVTRLEAARALRQHKDFLGLFVPSGVPKPLLAILVPIEIISFISRPISLAVRLFATVLAGHIALKIFAGFVPALLAAGAWGAAVRSVPTCRANAQSRRDRLGVELPRRP